MRRLRPHPLHRLSPRPVRLPLPSLPSFGRVCRADARIPRSSKKDKYPLGYPGDAFGPSSVPHYDCLGCGSLYPTGAEDGTPCRKCGREKTDQSPRALPRKIEPEPDPEVVRALEEKMKTLTVKPDA